MPDRPISIYDLLLTLGVGPRKGWDYVGPIREWFDGMSVDLAAVLLPTLTAAIRASTEGTDNE